MNLCVTILVPFIIALVAATIIHPTLVRFARMKDLVDNPNLRKLQLVPVPVLGGLGIFFGIMMGTLCSSLLADCSHLFALFCCMMLMMYIGALDDILDISPKVRLLAQIATVLILINAYGTSLDNFHGLWGVGQLPRWGAIVLTIVAVVGIINALNLIDGVDGLFATYSMTACSIFGYIFLRGGNMPLFVLSVAAIGSFIPFILHNAFGKKSKMFSGDSGTLLVGTMLSAFLMELVSNPSYDTLFASHKCAIVPFAFALFAIPVFDTVRVMTARICQGRSPLIGDKTHLHHMFIWLGVSHIGTTITIVALNCMILLVWWLAAVAGASTDVQFYVVVAAALVATSGLYYGVQLINRLNPDAVERFRTWKAQHKPNRRAFGFIQRVIDRL